ncbi:hypothetical protein BJ138DRAFT_1157083 [Hygrophoropsis aurantiaca]|uniref:Uncharacterized protein n=1 Tax=Hygrophoropsis aurantiaca TaxID=72124 RepID=A0ACB8A5T8_9AGAM|nr:hypothetical protein BJ138DRAFT_1157083 [Hygrophoropsis aurantiaca]
MSSSPVGPLDLDLNNSYGALFIGFATAAILFGLTNVQAFVYFQTHSGSGLTFYKIVTFYLWILDALHLAFIAHMIYHYLVTNYANPAALIAIVWSFQAQVVGDVLIIYAVHLLYVQRLWILSRGRSKILPSIITIMVALGSAVAITLIWAAYQCHVYSDLISMEWCTFLSLATICFLDMSIADSLVTKLMTYSLNSGLLTSICSLGAIVTCAAMPKNFIFLGVEFLCAKLYVNAYLALLNAQYYLSNGGEHRGSSGQARDRDVRINLMPLSGGSAVSKHGASMDADLTTKLPSGDGKPLSPNSSHYPAVAVTVKTETFTEP